MFALFRNVVRFAPLVLAFVAGFNGVALHSADNLGLTSRSDGVIRYQARVPLGWESFKVRSSGICFYLLGTVESPKFDGWQKVTVKERSHLYDAHSRVMSVAALQNQLTASKAIDPPRNTPPRLIETPARRSRARLPKVACGTQYDWPRSSWRR